MRGKMLSIGLRTLAIFAVTLLVTSTWAATNWKEKVLYGFCSQPNCTDGYFPYAGLIFDAAGNLYGTTDWGGIYGYGTVFELTPTAGGGWTERVLHSFNVGNTDGCLPQQAGLIFDAAGNLYGTTVECGTNGGGTVFELMPAGGGNWTETLLYSFGTNGQNDGIGPEGGLILDAAGNLYGTTVTGGTYQCGDQGCGTVFELTPARGGGWTETVLHNFGNGTDGYWPYAGLILDAAGNLYSTTRAGGTYGNGTVFKLSPNGSRGWTETVLHSFGAGTDGEQLYTGLIFDAAGNLYGTTSGGGTYGNGTVFELTPAGTETLLHSFNGTDGWLPSAGLIFDAAGNLYGTTTYGGTDGSGTAFKLSPGEGGWMETVLHNFNPNGTDGANPLGGLIFDAAGNLYGTTFAGGMYSSCPYGTNYCGTVFELTPLNPCAKCSHAVLQ